MFEQNEPQIERVPMVNEVSRVPRNTLVGLEVQFISYDVDRQPLEPCPGVVTGISKGGPFGIIITELDRGEGEERLGYLGGTQSPEDIIEIASERWTIKRICDAVRKSFEGGDFTPDQVDELIAGKRESLESLMQGELD